MRETMFYDNDKHKNIRFMPSSVLKELIDLSKKFTPDITLVIALSAFAGLRPGEACTVIREMSQFDSGIISKNSIQDIMKIEIQINKNVLRRGNLPEASFKTERTRCVYPEYMTLFKELYDFHHNYVLSRDLETGVSSMLGGKYNKVLTYYTYLSRFKYLIHVHLIPTLLSSDDQEKQNYASLLQEHNITPRILRHWFIMQLILLGEGAAQIRYWRGDKNIF